MRSLGLPVPNWQVVKDVEELNKLKFQEAEVGWTIRTCREDGVREMGLFYLNYADPSQVIGQLKERFGKPRGEFYLVYPSWQFRYSCNVVRIQTTYVVEGSYGSQKALAMGERSPDFGLRVPMGMISQAEQYAGSADTEVRSSLGRILHWCDRIPWEDFYTEVALKEDRSHVFYELMRT